jgi:hypothetical protein
MTTDNHDSPTPSFISSIDTIKAYYILYIKVGDIAGWANHPRHLFLFLAIRSDAYDDRQILYQCRSRVFHGCWVMSTRLWESSTGRSQFLRLSSPSHCTLHSISLSPSLYSPASCCPEPCADRRYLPPDRIDPLAPLLPLANLATSSCVPT